MKLSHHPARNYFKSDKEKTKDKRGNEKEVVVWRCQVVRDNRVCGKKINNNCSSFLKHLEGVHNMDLSTEIRLAQEEQANRKASKVSTVRDNKDENAVASVYDFFKTGNRGTKKLSRKHPRQVDFNKAISLWIGTTNIPISTTENEYLRWAIELADPSLSLAGRAKVKNDIDGLWSEVEQSIDSELSQARQVALEMDLWTSPGMKNLFIGITADFVIPGKNGKKGRKVHKHIACREFPGKHTGKLIARKMIEILKEKGIHGKIGCLTMDNGSR